MTMIELFDKRVMVDTHHEDKKNLPKRIKYLGSEFELNDIGEYVNDYGYTLFEMINSVSQMYDEVEILEDETDEIEELPRSDSYVTQIEDNRNKINELVRAVNKLNKQDVSKEINCMTD